MKHGSSIILVVLLAGVLAACGTPVVQTSTATAAAGPTAASTYETPAAASTPAPAAAPVATAAAPTAVPLAQLEVVAETAETRTLRHALGETTIPANPRRVLVADILTLGAYVSLEKIPSAACGYPLDENVGPFGPVITPRLAGKTEHLGGCFAFGGAFPLERFATLAPDVILAADVYAKQDNNYELLAEIAPTVAIPFLSSQRLAFFENVARTIGVEEQAQKLLDAHYTKLDAIKARLAQPLRVAVVALYAEGLTIFANTFAVNPSFERMGLRFDPVVQDIPGFEGDRVRNLSYEQLQLLAPADLLVVNSPGEGTEQHTFLEHKLADPLWQALPAVQQKNVVLVPESDLYATASILSYERATDQVAAFLEEKGWLAPAAPSSSANTNETASGAFQILEETDRYHLIKHDLGETQVLINPLRIISLAPSELANTLLALGWKPAGSITYGGTSDASGYPLALADSSGGIQSVANADGPNLEQSDTSR